MQHRVLGRGAAFRLLIFGRLLTAGFLLLHRMICAAPARVIIKLVLRERAFRTGVSCVRRSRRADNECPPGKRKP